MKYCPICSWFITIIEYPVQGVLTQFYSCEECGYENPVILQRSSLLDEDYSSEESASPEV